MCGRLTVTILAQMQNSFILESTFGEVVLYQWFSTEGILHTTPPPTPRNYLRKEIFWQPNQWRRCYWHLLGRGQGCSWASYNAQDRPTKKNYPAQNVNNASVEKPCSRSILTTALTSLLTAFSLHKLLQPPGLFPICQAFCLFLRTSIAAFSQNTLLWFSLLLFSDFSSVSLKEAFLHSLYILSTSSPPSLLTSRHRISWHYYISVSY